MRKLKKSCGRAVLCLFPYYSCSAVSSCLSCIGNGNGKNNNLIFDQDDDHHFGQVNKPLIPSSSSSSSSTHLKSVNKLKLKDAIDAAPTPTLAFHLKPKMVVMKVSMHCNGCARRVEKHISKLEGVSSYEVDLETKMVIVRGDIVPFQVLESVSKLKYAELWEPAA